jgi:hypothetical protein
MRAAAETTQRRGTNKHIYELAFIGQMINGAD